MSLILRTLYVEIDFIWYTKQVFHSKYFIGKKSKYFIGKNLCYNYRAKISLVTIHIYIYILYIVDSEWVAPSYTS